MLDLNFTGTQTKSGKGVNAKVKTENPLKVAPESSTEYQPKLATPAKKLPPPVTSDYMNYDYEEIIERPRTPAVCGGAQMSLFQRRLAMTKSKKLQRYFGNPQKLEIFMLPAIRAIRKMEPIEQNMQLNDMRNNESLPKTKCCYVIFPKYETGSRPSLSGNFLNSVGKNIFLSFHFILEHTTNIMLHIRYPGCGDESRKGDLMGDATTANRRKLGSDAVPASAFAGRAAENGKFDWLLYLVQRKHTKRYFRLPNLDKVIHGHNPYKRQLTEEEMENCFIFYVMQMVNEIAESENLFELNASVKKANMKATVDGEIVSSYQAKLTDIYNLLA